MPSTPKPVRTQARFDPNRGNRPPEVIELVDPSWILKALGLMLLLGLLCALATILFFHHYQKTHFSPVPANQTTQPRPTSTPSIRP